MQDYFQLATKLYQMNLATDWIYIKECVKLNCLLLQLVCVQ